MKYKKIIILIFLVLCTHIASASNVKMGSMKPAVIIPEGAQIVTIGFFPITIYDLDISSNTFYLDTYLWLKWKGDVDPTESMELVNAVDKSSLVKEILLDIPSILSDGSKYQIMRIEGHFFQPFLLNNFPLDNQSIGILIEDSTHGFQQISYQVDQLSSGIGDQLYIPGWHINNWNANSFTHDYGTSFGESDTQNGGGAIYSAVRFEINISRPTNYFFWKLLLPLIIVISASWVSLMLDYNLVETRTGMPATALLTTVFLQQGYSENLPQVGYLVLMDKIYVLAYILIVVSLVRAISTAYFDNDPSYAVKIKQNDRIILILQVIIFLSYVVWAISQT